MPSGTSESDFGRRPERQLEKHSLQVGLEKVDPASWTIVADDRP